MNISFHGADQGVTGFCHLVECAGQRILIDCGMYQGGREMVEENAEPMGFDPASIDFLLLTHATWTTVAAYRCWRNGAAVAK